MRKILLNVLCSSLILMLSANFVAVAAQSKTISIAGRIVDEKGKPVSDALVTFYYPPCRNCIDHILPVFTSLSDGVFFLDAEIAAAKNLRLFVQERVPAGFWSPFDTAPPFTKFSDLPDFRGLPILLPKKADGKSRYTLQVGDTPLQIRYGRIILQLPESLKKDYGADSEMNQVIKLIVRDVNKKIVFDNYLPKTAFDSEFAYLNLAIPVGQWNLELQHKIEKTTVKNVVPIRISNSSCTKIALKESNSVETICN